MWGEQMSQCIILICPKSLNQNNLFETITDILKPCDITTSVYPPEIQVHEINRNWYVIVEEMSDRVGLIDDYKSNTLLNGIFRRNVDNYIFYWIRFNNFIIVNEMMCNLLKAFTNMIDDIWIDNDYGVVINGNDVLSILKQNINWDWRL